jgi:phage terminase large subunit GpA-like protein
VEDLGADAVAAKVNRLPRGIVPPDCAHLTAFIDVGESVHFYAVVAWSESFSGSVIDYGTCPRQNRAYFASEDARPSLADVFPRHDVTARIYAGLRAVVESIIARPYPRLNGGEARVGVCLIDTGHKGDTVYAFCREHPLAAILMPGRGHGITAGKTPMDRWAARPGEKAGWYWKRAPVTGTNRGQHVIYDTNHWKSFTADRLLTPAGGSGCLSLFGDGPGVHQLFADHLTSESRVRTEGMGRTVDEWSKRVGSPNNHWWDCVVGCAVGASYLGVKWSAAEALGERHPPAGPRKKVSFAAMKADANARRKGA